MDSEAPEPLRRLRERLMHELVDMFARGCPRQFLEATDPYQSVTLVSESVFKRNAQLALNLNGAVAQEPTGLQRKGEAVAPGQLLATLYERPSLGLLSEPKARARYSQFRETLMAAQVLADEIQTSATPPPAKLTRKSARL